MGRLTDLERSLVIQFKNQGDGCKRIVKRLKSEKNITISKRGVKKIIQVSKQLYTVEHVFMPA